MGYEDVKLNLGKPNPCDLHIGQILYYEKTYILLEVEIVSIDCSLEDTLKLQCKEVVKGSERCTMFKFCGNKNDQAAAPAPATDAQTGFEQVNTEEMPF